MATTLRLTAISYGGEPRLGLTRRLGGGRFAVGRGTDNDWVLADPEKHLSSRHCVIEEHDGQYTITDFSRNGVFVNGAEKSLGRGCTCALNDGDRITIGDYEIAVEIETPATAIPPTPVFDEIGPPSLGLINPSGAEGPFPSPREPIVSAKSAPDRPVDWISEKSLGSGFEAFPPAARPVPGFPPPEVGRRGEPDPDHVPAVASFFRVPDVKPPIIPPDWNALEAERQMPPLGADEIASPPTPAFQPPPASSSSNITTGPEQIAVHPSEMMPQPAASGLAGDAVRAFFEGAGLPDADIGSVDASACMRAYGELLREFTSGIRELLFARAEMKSEFRIPQTVIRVTGNNPLKFSVDLEQALLAVLLPTRTGYAAPLAAVREAIADLRAHELGMLAGLQKMMAKVLGALAPETLERRVEAAGLLASVMPATRKARCWEAYQTAYHEIAAAVAEDAEGMFREAFAAAYSEQVKKL
jgi:type VI secretion system protein